MSACKFVGHDQPRVIPGRHRDDCADWYGDDLNGCRGCQRCLEPHCRVCGRTHADGTCAECLAAVRADLHEIGRMCDSLPEEVEVRGVEGEAMMLLGPVADPEAWGHVSASVAAGRLPREWVEEGGGELHPLTVLLTWQMVARDALDHDDAPDAELATAVGYLDRNLTYLAGYEHLPFEDMARDLRQCVSHLEAVLHDGEQRDEGVPCLRCGRRLQRVWGDDRRADGWECPRCRERSTDAQYRFAVKAAYIAEADWLTDVDMVARFPDHVTAATIRSWASDRPGRPATVRKRVHSERTEFSVEDVAATLRERGYAA